MKPAIRTITSGVTAGVLVALGGATASAQPASTPASAAAFHVAPVPFAVGEELQYKASFAGIRAGTATMKVAGIENVRGRPAYHIVFTIDGGIPLYRVRDRYESWVDVQTLASLRYVQNIREGSYHRNTTYEIFPDKAQYRKDDGALEPSVSRPLDDGSFIYAIRAAMPRVGETRRDDRYFRPDRNPVRIRVLRKEHIKVPAGEFDAVVVQPIIKSKGIFSENGRAEVWLSDDDRRIMLQMKSKLSIGSLNLYLKSYQPPQAPGQTTSR